MPLIPNSPHRYRKNKSSSAALGVFDNPNTTSCTIFNLESNQTYLFRIRTYRTVNGTTYFSAWSGNKKVRIK